MAEPEHGRQWQEEGRRHLDQDGFGQRHMGDRVEKTEHRRHTGGGAQQMQADTLCAQLAEAAGAEQDREQEHQTERIAGKDDQFAGQALQRQVLDHCRHHRQQQFTSNQQQCPACQVVLCHRLPETSAQTHMDFL